MPIHQVAICAALIPESLPVGVGGSLTATRGLLGRACKCNTCSAVGTQQGQKGSSAYRFSPGPKLRSAGAERLRELNDFGHYRSAYGLTGFSALA